MTMQHLANPAPTATQRTPWNKGKLIGAKPPFRAKHVWSIRTKLQVEGRIRDLAMFNLAIDSKLRGCDVVALNGHPHGAWRWLASWLLKCNRRILNDRENCQYSPYQKR
jgi:hypothetical protein